MREKTQSQFLRTMEQCDFYPFNGYEGLYEWSPTLESVRGLKSGKVLKWRYDYNGRPCVNLCKNGKVRPFFKAMFIYSHAHQCEIPEGYQVHHIDGNWTNNDPRNLQLLTKEEHWKIHAEERSKAVVAVDEKGNIVYRFASTWEAARNGFNHGAVSCAARGVYYDCKRDPHCYKGFRWFYEEDWLAMQQQQQPTQQPTQQLVEPTIQVDSDGQLYFFAD